MGKYLQYASGTGSIGVWIMSEVTLLEFIRGHESVAEDLTVVVAAKRLIGVSPVFLSAEY